MYVQEGLLMSVFFSALLTFIVSDRIFRSQEGAPKMHTFIKKTGETATYDISVKQASYDLNLRSDATKSGPAKTLLILGLVNYAFSFVFKNAYESYTRERYIVYKLEQTECDVPGSYSLASYSIVMVFGVGSFTIGMYTIAGVIRISHLLAVVICPMPIMRFKKKWHKIDIGFEHYEGEFDFDVKIDEEAPEILTEEKEKNNRAIKYQIGSNPSSIENS